MTHYILPPKTELVLDSRVFPLLSDGTEDHYTCQKNRYPLAATSPSGIPAPLFLGGVLTLDDLNGIVREVANHIASHLRSQTLLILSIYEGGRWFCQRLEDILDRNDNRENPMLHFASLKVSSYREGAKIGRHRVVQPPLNTAGKLLTTMASYDWVLIADDLIDSGSTFCWLLTEYLPSFKPKNIGACFLLEKNRPRPADLVQKLGQECVVGCKVPDEWLVGYGPDITFSGAGKLPDIHFCRGELPGGVYAFNHELVETLTDDYHREPMRFRKRWAHYISNA